MKILVIEPQPEFGGGMEGVALNISRELAARGHDIILAYQCEGSMLSVYEQFGAVSVRIDLPGFPLRQPIRTLKQLIQLARLIKRKNIDTIFSSHLGFLRVAAALRIMTGAKAWFHLGLPAGNCALSTRMSLKLLSGGISPSAHTKKTWSDVGWPASRLHEVRNFVDPRTFRPRPDKLKLRKNLSLPMDRIMIGYVGRIVPEKGVGTLVDAFNMLALKAPSANLALIGQGDPVYLETLAKKCLYPDRMLVLPPTPRTQEYYAALDIACVPSEWSEPFSLATVEAMASALPVVCADVGILAAILGPENQDLVTPAGDCRALAAVLLRLTSLGDLGAARGKALRERAVGLYGPTEVVDAYERIMTH